MFKQIARKVFIIVLTYLAGIMLIVNTYATIALIKGLDYKYTFVYKICPALVIKDPTSKMIFDNINGIPVGVQVGPVVILGDTYGEDDSVLMHELTHIKQGHRTLFVGHAFMYKTSAKYRLLAEYEAYVSEKGRFRDEIIIEILYENYNLNLTKEQITTIIEEHI